MDNAQSNVPRFPAHEFAIPLSARLTLRPWPHVCVSCPAKSAKPFTCSTCFAPSVTAEQHAKFCGEVAAVRIGGAR